MPDKIALGSGGRGKILHWMFGRCYDDVCVLAIVEWLDQKSYEQRAIIQSIEIFDLA